MAKILRTVAPGVNASLTSLFNASIRSGQIPRERKSAHVTPVFKGVGNYMSVLPVVVKLFEKPSFTGISRNIHVEY